MGLWTENKKKLLEAVLFLENNPIRLSELEQLLNAGSLELSGLLSELENSLLERDSVLKLHFIEDKVLLKPDSEMMQYLLSVYGEKEKKRFSRAALEVMSIIAWKQPVTRSEVDSIRGVDSSNSVRQLLEEDFIKVVGKKEIPGRPQTYGTTEKFLQYFGLSSLDELPRIEDIKEVFE